MTLWQIFLISGIAFLILEMFVPMMFFLNFAIGAFITAVIAVFVLSLNALIPIFVVVSVVLLFMFRPFLARHTHAPSTETGMEGQYIGQTAKVIEAVTEFAGAVTIYGERWNARSVNKEEIPVDSEVRIVKNESLILYVEKVK